MWTHTSRNSRYKLYFFPWRMSQHFLCSGGCKYKHHFSWFSCSIMRKKNGNLFSANQNFSWQLWICSQGEGVCTDKTKIPILRPLCTRYGSEGKVKTWKFSLFFAVLGQRPASPFSGQWFGFAVHFGICNTGIWQKWDNPLLTPL